MTMPHEHVSIVSYARPGGDDVTCPVALPPACTPPSPLRPPPPQAHVDRLAKALRQRRLGRDKADEERRAEAKARKATKPSAAAAAAAPTTPRGGGKEDDDIESQVGMGAQAAVSGADRAGEQGGEEERGGLGAHRGRLSCTSLGYIHHLGCVRTSNATTLIPTNPSLARSLARSLV